MALLNLLMAQCYHVLRGRIPAGQCFWNQTGYHYLYGPLISRTANICKWSNYKPTVAHASGQICFWVIELFYARRNKLVNYKIVFNFLLMQIISTASIMQRDFSL